MSFRGSSDLSPSPLGYDLLKLGFRVVLTVAGLELVHAERVPREGPAIIAANHIALFDPFAVGQATPRRVHFMAKKELFRTPLGRWFNTTGNAFPVDRSRPDLGAIRTALRILQAGQILVMFPQGTRGGEAARGGIGMIALRAKAPVVPAGIARKGLGYRIVYGEAFLPTGTPEGATEQVMAAIDALARQAGAGARGS